MLIADGGGGSVYRLHPPGGGVLPAPKPTPRPHSLDAGPRPTLSRPQVDPRILRAEGISRAQFMQQQAAAHQKEAVAEQQRAQQARQRADESQQQAEVAAARAREHGSKENKTLATQWGKQARDEELNALRCEADANFTGKQAALEKSKLKDMQEGHASEPSRETQAAQVEADSAASTVSLLYDTPAGEADPLKAAGHTTHQLAKAEKWGEWQDATQQELRIAGLRALAKGEDPQAAMREHAKAIERRDVDGMVFTSTGDKGKQSRITGEDWVQGLCDSVRGEDPAQAALNAEKAVAHKAWQPLLDAAEKKADQADSQVAADKKALTEAPGGLKRDYQDALSTSRQAAGEAGENLHWWESRAEVAGNGYQQRQADQDVHRTEVGYQVAQAVGDPKNAKDQTAIADTRDARDRALGDQVLVRSHGKLLAADVDAQGAKKDLKDAWGAYADASTGQVQARTVTYKGRGGVNTQTVYPEGYDKTFWAVPGSDEGKHVQLGDDGKYYYVSTSRGGHRGDVVETGREELNPVTAQVWAAYDKVHGRKENGPAQDGTLARQQQARDDYQSTNALLGSSSNGPGKLDPVFWERRSGEIEGDLSRAKADVAQVEQAINNARTYGGAQGVSDTLVAALGEKKNLCNQAQQQADALHAVQRWRASPGDKTLLDAAGQAVAKAGPAPDFSRSPLEGLRTDLSKAQGDKAAQQKIAAQPGDKQQAALDKISGLDLRIEHDKNLIAQAEAANQRSGALYLNSKFSFGDQAIDADGDVRFAMREDVDGHSIGLDAAPPLNYEELMARATDDGEAKVLGDSGIRILHDTLGLKDVWEVPLAHGMKQYIYQRDGQVFTTRTLADPGVRLSPQTEELWQRLWKADAGQDKADQAVAASTTSLDHWNQLNPADPIAAPGAPAPAAPLPAPPGLDGKPVKVPTLWDSDLGQRRDTLIARLHALQGSPEAGQMLEASGMQQAELDAVSAMKAAQDAHRALQQWQASPGQDCVKGVELRKAVSDAEDQAIDKKDKWLALCRSHGLESAKDARSTAQTRHQEWKDSHPALVGTEAERRTDSWAALQQAEGRFSGLEQQHIQAATPAAQAAQKALIDQNLSFDERQDPAKLHELFMQHPEVMAQALINEHYLQYGSGPLQMEGRTHLNNVVDGALGFQPDNPGGSGMPEIDAQGLRHTDQYRHLSDGQKASRDAVADEIEGIGGKQAKVTLLPVVYSTRQSGVVKTTLFKVEDGHGGAKYVDERGARYKDLDDYRANNELPSTDCNIVLPASDKVELDRLGNVKLQVRDGRTETGWETFKRRSHFDTIVGGASVVLGVVMTVGSGGMLAPVAAGLLVAASAYGATTSVMSLSNRASHGLSINPFTDREARLDWLNLAGSALAVPTLSAATRAGMVAWQATRAARAAGQISGRMPWLAIRGSKQTGEALGKMIKAGGPEGEQAAALQNKLNFWNTPGQVMAKPTMVVGGAGMEENTRYMADNWSAMSSDQRWEQGGMTLLNLVDFSAPVLVKGVQAGRQVLRNPAGSEPVAPVPAREPPSMPDANMQTFGSLPDAPLSAAAAAGPYQVGAVRKTKSGVSAPVTNAQGKEVAYIRQEVLGLRFVDKDGVDLPPHLVDELQRNGPLWPGGEPAQQPPTVRTTRVPLGPDGAPVNHVHLSEGGIVFKEGPYQKKVKARELSADEVNAWMEASRTQGADTIAKVLNSTAGMQIGGGPAKGIAVLDLPSDARVLLAQSIRTGQGGTAAGAGGAPVAVAFASGEQRRIGLVAPRTRHAAPGAVEVGRYIPRRASPRPDQVGPPRLWEAEHAFFEAAGRALHAHARQQGVAPAKIEGSINVYVDRSICDSCTSVSAQFQREFPGIRVSVRSTGPDEGGGHRAEPAGGPTPSDPTPGDPVPATSPERLSPPRRQGARPLPLSARAQGPGAQDRLVLPGGISVSHGGQQPDALQVNPAGGRENCVASAVTYDRIRHNPGLELGAVRSQPATLDNVIALYGGRAALQARGSRDLTGAAAAQRYLASLPEGTRGFLALSPPRSAGQGARGHVVNFEVLPGGRVEIVDAQAGRLVKHFEAPRVGVMVTHRPGMEAPYVTWTPGQDLPNFPLLQPRQDRGAGPAGEAYAGLFDRPAEPWPKVTSAASSSAAPATSAGQTATGASTPIDTATELYDPSITTRPDHVDSNKAPTRQSLRWSNFTRSASPEQQKQIDYLTAGHSPDGNATLQENVFKRFASWHKHWAGGFIGRRDDVGVIFVSRVGLTPHDAVKAGAITLDANTQVHGSYKQAKERTQAMLAAAQRPGQAAPAAWVFRLVGPEQVFSKGLSEARLPADTIDGALLVAHGQDKPHRVSWSHRDAAYAPKPGETFLKPAEAPGRVRRAVLVAGGAGVTAASAALVTYVGYRHVGAGDWTPTLESLGHLALGATAYRAGVASGRWFAANRLAQRVDKLQGLLQETGGRGLQWDKALNVLQHQLTGLRGAARGFTLQDRLTYHRAIEGLRRNPADPQFHAVLLTARDKVLSPGSVLGRTHLAVRIGSFAFSNASAAGTLIGGSPGVVAAATSLGSIAGNGTWSTQNTAHNLALAGGSDFKLPSPGAKERTYKPHALPGWLDNRLMRGLTLRHLTAHDGTLPPKDAADPPQSMAKPPLTMRLKQYAARLDQVGMVATLGAVDATHAIAAFSSGHVAAGVLETGRMAFDGLLVRAFQKDRIDEYRGNHGMGPVVYETRNPLLQWLNAPSRGAVAYADARTATDRIKQAGLPAMVLLGAGAAGRVLMGVLAPWDQEDGEREQVPQSPGAAPSATPSVLPSAEPSAAVPPVPSVSFQNGHRIPQ